MKLYALFVIALFALAACDGSGPVVDVREPALLYVANQDDATVSVIAQGTNVLVRTVDLRDYGFDEDAKPHHVAVESDGSFWYVTLIGAGAVLKMDRADSLVARLDGFATPGMVVLHPSRDLLFVGRSLSAPSPPTSIAVVQRSNMALLSEPGVLFPRPHALAATSSAVYTASLSENQIIKVALDDPASPSVEPAAVAGPAQSLAHAAASPDGETLYITGDLTSQLHAVDLTSADLAVTTSYDLPDGPWHPVITPDGRSLYIGNKRAGVVTVVDLTGDVVADTIQDARFVRPHGSAVSADGRYVYISDNGPPGEPGFVAVIRRSDNTVEAVIPAGRGAAGVGAARR